MHLFFTWIRDSWEVKKVYCYDEAIDRLLLDYYLLKENSFHFLSDYINDLFRWIKSLDLAKDIYESIIWTENWFKEVGIRKLGQCELFYIFGSPEKREAIDNSIKAYECLVNDVRSREEDMEQKILILLDFIYDVPFTIESGCDRLELNKDLIISSLESIKTRMPQKISGIGAYAA